MLPLLELVGDCCTYQQTLSCVSCNCDITSVFPRTIWLILLIWATFPSGQNKCVLCLETSRTSMSSTGTSSPFRAQTLTGFTFLFHTYFFSDIYAYIATFVHLIGQVRSFLYVTLSWHVCQRLTDTEHKKHTLLRKPRKWRCGQLYIQSSYVSKCSLLTALLCQNTH